MPLNPEELRAEAQAARDAATRKAKAAAASERQARRERAAAALSRVPEHIKTIETYDIPKAAKEGRTFVVWTIPHNFKFYFYDSPDYVEFLKPVAEALVAYFTAAGFDASHKIQGTTEYFSDGAGPGVATAQLVIDWSK